MRGNPEESALGAALAEDEQAAAEASIAAAAARGVDMVLARDLRAIRRGRGLSLAEVSSRIGRSIGFLSQIERGLSTPSVEDLRRLAAIYQTSLGLLFGRPAADPADLGRIVRASGRRRLGAAEHGLVEELLSPDLSGEFEMLLSCFSAGANSPPLHRPDIEEAGFVVSGRFEIELDGEWRRLDPGDSFRIRGEPFRWRVGGDEEVVVVWVVAPPIY